MPSLPDKCVVDTNVPKTANMAVETSAVSEDLLACVLACVEAIEHLVNDGTLVIDDGGEILDEYGRQLSRRGQPGQGDKFMKWVHDHQYMPQRVERVKITRSGDSYVEFPSHEKLCDFDPSDRKFVAVANAHTEKPHILEATDSKWWGWKDALAEVGITVRFMDPEYVETKFAQKMDC
jgi:hypothetical protein